MSGPFRYFCYGSGLSRRHIAEWATGHGVDPALFEAGTPARLGGHRLAFDVESRSWGGRVADLLPEATAEVHGVLFTLPESARQAIEKKEGVPTGLTVPAEVSIEAGGQPVTAVAFVARPERRVAEGPPSPSYLKTLQEGAAERGLPESWQRALANHAAARPPSPGPSPLGIKR